MHRHDAFSPTAATVLGRAEGEQTVDGRSWLDDKSTGHMV